MERPFHYISISFSFYLPSCIQDISVDGMQVTNKLKN